VSRLDDGSPLGKKLPCRAILSSHAPGTRDIVGASAAGKYIIGNTETPKSVTAVRAEAGVRGGSLDVSLRGLRLLVVDDHEDARRILRMVFEYCRAEVFIAESAREALPLFERVRPHVVVTDIAMPRGDGYRLLRAIRALPGAQGGRTPVVAVTAYRELHDETRVRRAGFDAWLTKPIDIRKICSVIERLVAAG
jgi:CheY-like chemotaxis protein